MKSPVVLIAGALTGIGRATALAFARKGARVVVSGWRDEEGRRLVAPLHERGDAVDFFRADVRRERRRAEPSRRCRRGGTPVAMPWNMTVGSAVAIRDDLPEAAMIDRGPVS